MVNWIICTHGRGFLYVNGEPEKIYTSFNKNSVGEIKEETDTHYHVWLIGTNTELKCWIRPGLLILYVVKVLQYTATSACKPAARTIHNEN